MTGRGWNSRSPADVSIATAANDLGRLTASGLLQTCGEGRSPSDTGTAALMAGAASLVDALERNHGGSILDQNKDGSVVDDIMFFVGKMMKK